ncbi:MAG: HAMP domain-containing sensor histidine kinase [Ketobacteraceae bacterium]|nr:HAMP domain-containing sensor histidine kinase [Ketobacteraceae bacterium]
MSEKKTDSELFGALLAASIHEIKNRFGLLYSELDGLLNQLPQDESRQQQVEGIKSEAQFIGSELMRVLSSYKSLAGDFAVNVDQQFAVEFLEEVLVRHGYTFSANKVTAELECDEETSGFFDISIATIVMDTLIYNAIKAGARQLLFTAHEDDLYLYLQLHDDGPGFPESMLEGDISQSTISVDHSSTGLGLYFAQSLLSAHREGDRVGHLSLGRSDRLEGARVTLAFPH